MLPPAPGRLSTTTGCFQLAVIFSASMRAIRPPALPGGKGTTKRTGLAGYVCAAAAPPSRSARNKTTTRGIGLLRAGILRSLVPLRSRSFDDLAEPLDLGADEGAEFGRGAAERLHAEREELVAHLGHLEHASRLGVDALDQRRRCSRRRGEAEPGGDIEAGKPLAGKRMNLGSGGERSFRSEAERFQLARFHLAERRRRTGEGHRHVAGERRVDRIGRRPVWNVL